MHVIWYPATTIDGYIADVDGDSDWVTAEDEELFSELVQSCGAVIVGRATFDQFHGSIYPIAGATTYVCTSRPADDIDGVRFVSGSPSEVLERVRNDGLTAVVLSGGGDVNGRFAKANLIDEAIVSVYPKVFGGGTRLLGSHELRINLGGSSWTALHDGVIQLRSTSLSFSQSVG